MLLFSSFAQNHVLRNHGRFLIVITTVLLSVTGTACSGNGTSESTTTTTIAEKPFGVTALSESLPTAINLPSGWTISGSPRNSSNSTLEPKSGKGFGICGGPNQDQRLQLNDVVAWATSPALVTERGGFGVLRVFEFPNSIAASKFLQAGAAQATCGSITYDSVELGEGVTPGKNSDVPRVNIFSGTDNKSKWKTTESVSVGGPLASSTVEGMSAQKDVVYVTTLSGRTFGRTSKYVWAFEKYMNLVILYSLEGTCCVYGFSNSKSMSKDTTMTLSDVDLMAQLFRQKLLEKLGLGLLSISVTTSTTPGT